jgi:hypothetical protein
LLPCTISLLSVGADTGAAVAGRCCPAVVIASGLLFFTTYTLLVLFWAEIYHQARSMPTASLRPIFIAFNALVYACQVRSAQQQQQQHHTAEQLQKRGRVHAAGATAWMGAFLSTG